MLQIRKSLQGNKLLTGPLRQSVSTANDERIIIHLCRKNRTCLGCMYRSKRMDLHAVPFRYQLIVTLKGNHLIISAPPTSFMQTSAGKDA